MSKLLLAAVALIVLVHAAVPALQSVELPGANAAVSHAVAADSIE